MASQTQALRFSFSWLQLAGVYHVFNAAQLVDGEGNPCPELDDGNFSNHAAYLQSWMQKLSDDPSYLFHAAAGADKASAYLMGRLAKDDDAG